MRAVSLGQPLGKDDFMQWALGALREIETASYEDAVEVADAFSITGTLTETRTLNVAAPTAANVAAVLGTLINDLKRRGTYKNQ